jgi:hypothetical protein
MVFDKSNMNRCAGLAAVLLVSMVVMHCPESVAAHSAVGRGAPLGPIARACTGKTASCDYSNGGHSAVPGHFTKNVKEKWFENQVNHFGVNFAETSKTFQQRYFIDDTKWKVGNTALIT